MKLSGMIALALVPASVILLKGCGEAPLYRASRLAMGTTAAVEMPLARFSRDDIRRYCRDALDEITRLDRIFSMYIEGSDIYVLNQEKRLSSPSEETWQILNTALEYHEITGGAFDISVGAVEEAWRGAARYGGVPDEAEIKEALAHSGADKLVIDDSGYEIYLPDERTIADLGGIAKGYAADMAADALRSRGIKNALVNIGGDISCVGRRGPRRKWRIGIRDPLIDPAEDQTGRPGNGIIAVLELEDDAVATSGDYENYEISGGRRYSHIMDPRTGEALSSDVSSVTVIADSCTEADALATAVSVLGVGDGLALVDQLPDVECYIVTIEDGSAVTHQSAGMKKYLQ